jgi:hypothetical protein
MQPGDPRADPVVVDLIELAGQWVAANDWPALSRTLRRLDDEICRRFPNDAVFATRFRQLEHMVEAARRTQANVAVAEAIRRSYRQASFG